MPPGQISEQLIQAGRYFYAAKHQIRNDFVRMTEKDYEQMFNFCCTFKIFCGKMEKMRTEKRFEQEKGQRHGSF